MNRINLILTSLILCAFAIQTSQAQTPFITIWNTMLPGDSGPNQIIYSANGFFYDIAWEEVGNPANNGSLLGDFGQTTITFPTPGIYRVSVSPGFGFLNNFDFYIGGDEEKLIDIEQWGTIAWNSMGFCLSGCSSLDTITANDVPNLSNSANLVYMFSACTNLRYVNNLENWNLGNTQNLDGLFENCPYFNQSIEAWDISNITSTSFMFNGALSFNQPLGNWDVSNVNIMFGMFSFARSFNQDIGMWDVTNVTIMDMLFMEADSFNQNIGAWDVSNVGSMSDMFWGADSFNQDIGNWNVGNVTRMSNMFFTAESFNQDIGNWDVRNVTTMEGMFLIAPAFNQDIGDWNVSNVNNMAQMFAFATSFNQDISQWDVRKVNNMSAMFQGATSFNQDLRYWDVSRVANMSLMFSDAQSFNQPIGAWQLRAGANLNNMLSMSGLDCSNYSTTLTGWAGNPSTPDDLVLGAIGLQYGTGAIAARNTLLNKGWTISDAGEDSGCDYDPDPFITIWDSEQAGASDTDQILIPATGSNFEIHWAEVGNESNNGTLTGNGNTTVTFPSPGIYRIQIQPGAGTFEGIIFNNTSDRRKLLEIEQWGTSAWSDLENAFYGCENLIISAVDVLPLNNVMSMQNLFRDCDTLRGVPNMSAWATSTVMNMQGMCMNAPLFNQPLKELATGSVVTMRSMFENATSYDNEIGAWDISLVEDLGRMFYNASSFHQPLEDWNTSGVETMDSMFYNATAFNQRLDDWDLGALDVMASPLSGMLSFSGIACRNYSFTLAGWANAMNTPDDLVLGADGLSYSPQAAFAHHELTNVKNWTINDAGEDANCELFSDDFITVWKTNNQGASDNNQIIIPGTGTNYTIKWEDVQNTMINGMVTGNGTTTVTFPSAGTYRIRISPGAGSFTRINMLGAGDRLKLIRIENWGSIPWSNLENAFVGCDNLTAATQDTINLSAVTSLRFMFQNCPSITTVPFMEDWNMVTITNISYMFQNALNFNHPIGSWNVSNVTNMQGMFQAASSFNQDIGAWNTMNVTNMANMFEGASAFNQDIGSWSTGNVTTMDAMFTGANSFNQDLNWNTGKVTTMNQLFDGAISFNGDISGWNTSKVKNMNFMFRDALVFNSDISAWQTDSLNTMLSTFNNAAMFNQDIGGWNTAKVTSMLNTFYDAVSFNQDIGNWNTGKVTSFGSTFRGAINFNQDIGGWNTSSATSMGFMFYQAYAFNQDISMWNTSKVTALVRMFSEATSFNQDIGGWNTSKVTNMASVFNGATSFNQDIGSWQTGKATTMAQMFYNATAFDQDLSDWEVDSVVNFVGFLDSCGMSVAHYDSLLIGWAEQDLKSDLDFGAATIQFCAGEEARDSIISQFGWTFNDAGKNCCTQLTTWSGSSWDNGAPSAMHHAVFTADYNTALNGNLQACSMAILPGVTVTVEANDMIEVESLVHLGGVLHVKQMGNLMLGEN